MSIPRIDFEQMIFEELARDPEDFGLDPDFMFEDPSFYTCEICGCSEQEACEGGCSWSERFLIQGRLICTQCEAQMVSFRINMGALKLWRLRKLLSEPSRVH